MAHTHTHKTQQPQTYTDLHGQVEGDGVEALLLGVGGAGRGGPPGLLLEGGEDFVHVGERLVHQPADAAGLFVRV